ncbi:MAG: hypothetical protein JXM71_11985, partial [Spirochaetales bacterium]|nr:hypothetical protein [Spirochaetales bacterium]
GVAAVIFLAGFVRRFPSTPNLKSSRLIWLPVLALCAKYALIVTRILTFYGPAIYFIHTVLGVSLIYIISLLIKQYHAATAGGRRKLHWLIAGITLSLVPYIVFVFTLVLYMDMLSSSLIVFSTIANFSILLFPVFVGIGVVRFNLFDIDRFLNRFIVLFFLAFAFTILYSVVFMLFFESTLTLELYLILLLTALLSPTVYLRLDSLVTGILHKGHKDTRQILLEMEQELTGIYRSSSVFPVVSTSLVFAFDPSTIQFIKTDGDTRTLEFSYPATLSMVDHSQTGGVALPLGRQGTGSLVLSLGRKRDDDIYTQDDIHLLTSAASHISKTLQYCELYSQLEESLANESDAQKVAILSLAKLTEYRDEETGKHLERIQEYTR